MPIITTHNSTPNNRETQIGRTLFSHALIKRTYRELLATIEFQKDTLGEYLVPYGKMSTYSLIDQDELHFRLTAYTDLCISSINHLINAGAIKKQDLPLAHNLLRWYRDNYQHISNSDRFRPIRWKPGNKLEAADFFIWPVLSRIKKIKEKVPNWCSKDNQVSLVELLVRNQDFIDHLFLEVRTKLSEQENAGIKLGIGYDSIGGGKIKVSNEDSWKVEG